jgi:hypothetical protein
VSAVPPPPEAAIMATIGKRVIAITAITTDKLA